MHEPQSAGDALQRLLQQLGLEQQLRVYRALMHWDTIVGTPLTQVARPLRLDTDTLWVAVKSHAWVQELTFHKRTILQRLNERVGEERFREIRFTVRSELPNVFHSADDAGAHAPPLALPSPSEAEVAAVEATLQEVSEPTLREVLRRAQLASLQYQKFLEQSGWRRCAQCGCYYNQNAVVCSLCSGGA